VIELVWFLVAWSFTYSGAGQVCLLVGVGERNEVSPGCGQGSVLLLLLRVLCANVAHRGRSDCVCVVCVLCVCWGGGVGRFGTRHIIKHVKATCATVARPSCSTSIMQSFPQLLQCQSPSLNQVGHASMPPFRPPASSDRPRTRSCRCMRGLVPTWQRQCSSPPARGSCSHPAPPLPASPSWPTCAALCCVPFLLCRGFDTAARTWKQAMWCCFVCPGRQHTVQAVRTAWQ
jgi:hypothetical protein